MATITKDKLQKLVDDVTASLSEVLNKAEKPELPTEELNKATPGNEAPAEKVPAGSSTESSSEESSGAEESSSPSGSTDGDKAAPADGAPAPDASATAPADGAPAPDASASADSSASQDPAQDAGGSVESLQAEYAALPLEELKMHMLACKAALISQMAQGGAEDQSAAPADGASAPDASATPGASPAASPAAPSAPPPSDAEPPMAKSQDNELLDRIANLEKSLKEKDELLNGFGTALTKFNEKLSTRKGIAHVSAIMKPGTELAKSEDKLDLSNLSFDEIKSQLNTITATTKLNKSDQTAVLKFVAGNDKDTAKIAHLLKKN